MTIMKRQAALLLWLVIGERIRADLVSAFTGGSNKSSGRRRRGHQVSYNVGTLPQIDVIAPPNNHSLGNSYLESLSDPERRKRGESKETKKVPLQIRRMARPKSLTSSAPKAIDATLSRHETQDLLTHDEERVVANQIRMLRTVVRIRDELAETRQPTEDEWAKACGMTVGQLRSTMAEGQVARSTIVAANAGLVGSIAKRYFKSVVSANQANGGMGTILSFHDLVQEGNLGLMEAAERFEPERGFRFSTYATWWVRQRMLRAISDYSRIIRLPAHVHSMIRKIQKARKDVEKEIGRTPSTPELAHYLGISVEKLQMYSDSSRTVLSLEHPIRGNKNKPDEKAVTLGEFISSDSPTPDEDAESRSLREVILSVVDELPAKERDVLIARFGLSDGTPQTVDETAQRLGLSRDVVRVVEARALNKLRHPQRNHRLKSYVGGEVMEDQSSIEEEAPSSLSPEQIWSF